MDTPNSQEIITNACHGTSEANAHSIRKSGFDLSKASTTGYFGKGIYFAEDCLEWVRNFFPKNGKGAIIGCDIRKGKYLDLDRDEHLKVLKVFRENCASKRIEIFSESKTAEAGLIDAFCATQRVKNVDLVIKSRSIAPKWSDPTDPFNDSHANRAPVEYRIIRILCAKTTTHIMNIKLAEVSDVR